jgi:MFS family permease
VTESPLTPSRALTFGRYDRAACLTYFAYAAGSVVAPVSLVEVARDLGFRLDAGGMTAGGALHLGRTGAIVAAMLLCGFWAARWGKRATLGLSVILMAAGMAACALAPSYGFVFLALAAAGIGEGVIEGLATPFVQDLHPEEPGRYVNLTHAFWSVGVLVTVLASGALLAAGVPWRLVVGGVALAALLPAVLLLARPDPAYAERREPLLSPREVWGRVHFLFAVPRFWVFFAAMFVAGGGEFCLTFWSASFIQLHFSASAWVGGVGTACFAAGMALGRTGGGYLVAQRHLKAFICWSAVAGVLVSLLLPAVGHLGLFLVLLFLVGVATAPFWPSIQSYSADRIPEADTTLLMILLACAGIPGCGFATWLTGYIGDHSAGGLATAFYLVPACYLILLLLVGCEGYVRNTTHDRLPA